MVERGYVRFDDALNGTLEAPVAPLPTNIRTAADLTDGALVDMLTAKTTASKAIVSDADGDLAASSITVTELGYLSGVTSAIQTQIAAKEASITAGTTGQYWRGDKSWQTLDKTAVGLGNVDNTSDASKPISTLTQAALDLKAPLASPTFTGSPAVPTAAPGTNTTQAASTAFVAAAVAGVGAGDVVGPASVTADNPAVFDGTTGKLIKQLTYASFLTNLISAGLATPGLVLISAQTASAVAAVDFTSGIDSTYDEYEIHIQNAIPASDAALNMRTSTDAGSSFDAGASDYAWHAVSGRPGGSPSSGGSTATDVISLIEAVGQISVESTATGYSGVVRIIRPSVVQNCQVNFSGGYIDTAGRPIAVNGIGVRLASADVDGIRLLFSTGNIASGIFKLYGVRKS